MTSGEMLFDSFQPRPQSIDRNVTIGLAIESSKKGMLKQELIVCVSVPNFLRQSIRSQYRWIVAELKSAEWLSYRQRNQ